MTDDRQTRAQSQKQTRADRMRKYDPTDAATDRQPEESRVKITDEQREQAIREVFRVFPNADGPTVPDVKALLRLLDIERAKVTTATEIIGVLRGALKRRLSLLTAERAKVARIEALAERWAGMTVVGESTESGLQQAADEISDALAVSAQASTARQHTPEETK